jgi:hypothetical protein
MFLWRGPPLGKGGIMEITAVAGSVSSIQDSIARTRKIEETAATEPKQVEAKEDETRVDGPRAYDETRQSKSDVMSYTREGLGENMDVAV